jgi:predicted ABC-type ATPase
MPNVVMLGGPNGAGKTTASRLLLRDALQVSAFVNADVIAQGLSGINPAAAGFEAGMIMVRRLLDLAEQKVDFAFETTLAGKNFVRRVKDWKAVGYQYHLIFLWLPSAEAAISRVRDRVRRGGHHVPEVDVRKRYESGLRNFFNLYRPLADTWRFFDNTNPAGPRLLAFGTPESQDVFDHSTWDQVHRQVQHADQANG